MVQKHRVVAGQGGAGKRRLIYASVAAFLIGIHFSFHGGEWRSGAGFHTNLEIAATLLAAVVGVMALVRFYSHPNNTFLFIGAGFLGTAFLDAYHTVVTSTVFAPFLPSDLSSLIPWSWIAPRLFLSAMLVLSWLFWLRERRLGDAGRIGTRSVYLISGTLTVASFLFFAFVPLPRAHYPELYFSRPEEFVPAMLFLVALIGYLRKGEWRHEAIDHWLVLALIVGLAGEAVYMSVSARVFDADFDIAHLLKNVSYLCVFVGLVCNTYHLFRRAEVRGDELNRINDELRLGLEEREKVEQALRANEQQLRAITDHSPALIDLRNTSSHLLMINKAYKKFHGITEGDALGHLPNDWLGGDMAEQSVARDRKVILTKQPQILEYETTDVDGTPHTLHSVKFPVLDSNDAVIAVGGIVTDVTENRKTEAELRKNFAEMELLRKVTFAANELKDAEQTIKATLDEVCAHIGWPVGHAYITPDDSTRALESSRLWHLADRRKFAEFRNVTEATRFAEGIGLPGRVLATGKSVWIEDVRRDATFLRTDCSREIHVRCGFGFPVCVGKVTVAVLEFFTTEPEIRDEALLRLMQQVGTQLGRALERKRYQEKLEGTLKEMELVASRLRESEESLLNITANVPGIVYQQILAPDGQITYPFVSEGIREICGLEAEAIKRDPSLFLRQIHPADRKNYTDAIQKSALSLEPLALELRFSLPSGRELWLHDYSRAKPGADGTIIRDAIMFDITDRKRMEKDLAGTQTELQNHVLELEISRSRLQHQSAQLLDAAEALTVARDHAEQANVAKSQFLANVSHELRTPLNAVIGLSAILRADALSDELDMAECCESLADIHEAGQQLLVLINDILDLSKAEAGKFELEEVEFDLRDVIAYDTKTVNPRLKNKNIDLRSSVLPGTPVHLVGDPIRLRQILLNLVDNGLKFTEQGNVSVRVSVESDDLTGVLCRFDITDTGIGIAKHIQHKLFTSFTQADASATRKFGGTGLGLAICKEIAIIMGGEIGVESDEGTGSTFWFTARFRRSQTVSPTAPAALDRKGLRVLVVGGIDANQEFLLRQLSSWGLVAALAPDATAALEALENAARTGRPFDVALINHRMPETDGDELAARVRGTPRLAATRLVLIDSSGRSVPATDPFDGFLVQPVVQSDLFDCLTQLFEDRVSMPGANGHAKTEDNRTGSESPWPRTLTAPEMEAAEQTQQSVAAPPNGTDRKPQPTQVDERR